MKAVSWNTFFEEKYIKKYGQSLCETIYLTILEGTERGDKEIVLFESNKTNTRCMVGDCEYIPVLEQCLNFFIKVEDYETCAEIRDLINELNK